jgi:type II secretory pathway pseudopilin PulG
MTLIELIVSIAILLIVGTVTIGSLNKYRERQALDKSVAMFTSILERARAKTLTNEKNTIHSVRLNTERMVLFQGGFSSSSVNNEYYSFDPLVEIGQLSLTSGTNTLSYRKLTGQSLATGTVELRLKRSTTTKKSVIIYSSGLIEAN